MDAATLLLADGRFPSGGHAHSGGFEAASRVFSLDGPDGLVAWLEGRLATTGATEAHLVAAVGHRLDADGLDWRVADAEIDARIVSPALRKASRSLGRQWLRAGARVWPHPALDELGAVIAAPHQVAAFSAVAHAAGLDPTSAVRVHLHHLVATATTAAVRLHGLDPFVVQRIQVDLAPTCRTLAADAVASASAPWAELPAPAGPLTEILAEVHHRTDGRLFQS